MAETTENAGIAAPLAWRTMREAARRIQTSERSLKRAAARGELKHVRINARGDLRVLDEWLDQWLLGLAKR